MANLYPKKVSPQRNSVLPLTMGSADHLRARGVSNGKRAGTASRITMGAPTHTLAQHAPGVALRVWWALAITKCLTTWRRGICIRLPSGREGVMTQVIH